MSDRELSEVETVLMQLVASEGIRDGLNERIGLLEPALRAALADADQRGMTPETTDWMRDAYAALDAEAVIDRMYERWDEERRARTSRRGS